MSYTASATLSLKLLGFFPFSFALPDTALGTFAAPDLSGLLGDGVTAAIWLLASGLLGIVGIRRKVKPLTNGVGRLCWPGRCHLPQKNNYTCHTAWFRPFPLAL